MPSCNIELRKWADVMLVVPLDANTVAEMTNGISDKLLTLVLRAWDPDGVWNPPARYGWMKVLGYEYGHVVASCY